MAEYSVLLMHATPGKCWSAGELTAFLDETGFVDVDYRPTAADRTLRSSLVGNERATLGVEATNDTQEPPR